MDVEDAIVEMDYTSQMHKDLQKRRRFLFRLAMPNEIVYLLQAPSENQRTNWFVSKPVLTSRLHFMSPPSSRVLALQNAARRFEGDDTDCK